MKGFAVSPIIFIGLFIITALMLISFSDLDRKLTDGITKISSLKKLEAEYLLNKTSAENLLHLHSVFGLNGSSTEAQLKANISRLVGEPIDIVSCSPTYFTTRMVKNFYRTDGPASINRTYSIIKNITCIDVAALNVSRPLSVSCSSAAFSCA